LAEKQKKSCRTLIFLGTTVFLPDSIYASGDVSPIFFLPPIFLTLLIFPLSLHLTYKIFQGTFRLERRVGYVLSIAFNGFLNALLLVFLYTVYSGGPSGSAILFLISLLISTVLALAFTLQQKPKLILLPLIFLLFTISHIVLLLGSTIAFIAILLNIK